MTPASEPRPVPGGESASSAAAPAGVPLYGLLADFPSAQALLDATQMARDAGYVCMDAHTPYPIEEVSELINPRPSKLPWIVLIGGAIGGASGYALQYYSAVIDYPINAGGRPLHSWPMFIPITFELTILAAGLSAVLGMFILNRLPMPYHPIFNAQRFALASRDRYFLSILAEDPRFDSEATRAFLVSAGAENVEAVPLYEAVPPDAPLEEVASAAR